MGDFLGCSNTYGLRKSVLLALICLWALSSPCQEVTLHSQSIVVLVPTLVTDGDGNALHRLSAEDFYVLDNGVEQTVKMDSTLVSAPVSMVVVIDQGKGAGKMLDKVRRAGSMIDPIVGDGKGKVALVGFDSKVKLLSDFTSDTDDISAALKQVKLGDSGAAILDAIRYSSRLLERCSKTDRKVILLMSETKDSGSMTTESEVLRQIEASNTMVYSIAYSSVTDSLFGEPQNTQSSVNLLTVFSNIVKATKENVAKTLAQLSGGEYLSFGSERVFEDRVANINNHFFNQYLLSFQPKRPDAGQHTIQVGLRHPAAVNVYARAGYWVQGTVPEAN